MHCAAIIFWTSWALILYTYIFFPTLLAVVARRKAGTGAPIADLAEKDLPKVAIIVAAYNEEAVIAAKLQNAWDIDYPADKFEILIGSDGSDDRTPRILADCNDSRLRAFLYTQRRGKISV